MAKSRGRKFAEITSPTSGVFDLTSVPTITNAKLQNSAMTLAGSSVSLGGTGVADTDALSEGSSNLYFTNARVQTFLGGGTLAGNIVVPDNRSIYVGSQSDFRIIHNTTNTQLTNITGALQITSSGALALSGSYVAVTGAATFSADLTVDTDTLKVDSTNNRVGIGTTTPTTILELKSASATAGLSITGGNSNTSDINLGDTDDINIQRIRSDHSDDSLQFFTNNAERVRIDSSGRLLIGKTSTGLGNTGVEFESGQIKGTAVNQTVAYLNRTGSDGDVIQFRRDNTPFGEISKSSTRFTIEGPDNPVRIATGTSNIQINHDTHITFDTAGSEVMRIDSSGTLKLNQADSMIMTNADTSRLRLFGGSSNSVNNGAVLTLHGVSHSSGNYVDLASGTGGHIQFRIGTSEKLRINSSGNVGIGISPTKKLTVFGTGAGDATVQIEGEGGADPYINFLANNTQHWSVGIDDSDDDKFKISKHSALGTNDYFTINTAGATTLSSSGGSAGFLYLNYVRGISDGNTGINIAGSDILELQTGGSARLKIDGSGNVTIQSGNLNFMGGTNDAQYIKFGDTDDDDIGNIFYYHGNNNMVFTTNTSEAMRLDSSGNLLVGTTVLTDITSSGTGNEGSFIKADGSSGFATSNQTLMTLNRKTSNGDVFEFRMNGALIGSIGIEGGDSLYIQSDGTSGGGLRFHNNGGIAPMRNGSLVDSVVDLGTSTKRFRNIYLSGTVTAAYIAASNSVFTGSGGAGGNALKAVYGSTTTFKVQNTGNVTISGALSKGSGSFKIDHPLESKKDTHHLVHSFVEAPQADNIYRGSVELVGGSASVNLDTAAGMTEGTFVLLNTNVQCFTSNESGWTAIKGSVSGNILTITAQEDTCTDTISWMVVGERQDKHMKETDWTDENGKVIVEPKKETTE